jgi:tetratricopeptide (TPR) repeat protein
MSLVPETALPPFVPYHLPPVSRRAAVIIAALVVLACGAPPRELQPTPLPDLSHLDEPVRAQIRARHDGLEAELRDRGASDAALANAFGEYGMILHASEYFEAARPAYVNAETLASSDPRWPYYLGILSRTESKMEQAAAAFERARTLRPDDVPTLVWLGRTYLDLGQPDQAQAMFARARTLAPNAVAPAAGLGQASLARRDYQRAVDALQEALRLNPGVRTLHAPLAQAYRAMGDSRRAEAEMAQWTNTEIPLDDPLKQALDTLVNSGQAYQLRGTRALETHDFAEAERLFREGVAVTPAATPLGRSLRQKLGTALALRGDVDGARRQFEAAIATAPAGEDESAAKAHYSLGVMLMDAGDRDGALRHFRSAVEKAPHYVEALVALGDALRQTDQPTAAIAAYEDAVRVAPRATGARLGYALALVKVHRFADARAWLENAVREQPDAPQLANALARLYAAAPDPRVRDGRRAFAITQKLVETQPRTTELGETMAMTLAELGNFDEAVAIQRDILAAARRAGAGDDVRRMEANLRLYERRQPCRDPWMAGAIAR